MPDTALDAQNYVAEAQRRVWDLPDVPADTPTLEVRRVGIIGAGTMGGGIAMNFANIGLSVTLVETRADALQRGLGVVRKNYERSAGRGRFPMEEVQLRMDRINGGLEFSALGDCDLVIEAVYEDLELKKRIFTDLDRTAKAGAILATNTSGLDVDQIAAQTGRPESVIGLHFFSPANVMKLVEVVRGAKTSKEVIATSMSLAKAIGKIAVLVGVCPGFVGNRILHPRQQQAYALLMQGAMPWDVDRVMNAFGFKMGPFAMSDLAGLDIGWSRETSDGRKNLRDLLVENGRLGQKNGRGFYDYDADRTARPSPEVEQMIRGFPARGGGGGIAGPVSDQEILERCLYPMANEGARILTEGVADRPSDIDVVWLQGYGWPADKGGPMFYADGMGLAHVAERLDAYAERYGEHLRPAPLLRRLAAQGRGFADLAEGEARSAA